MSLKASGAVTCDIQRSFTLACGDWRSDDTVIGWSGDRAISCWRGEGRFFHHHQTRPSFRRRPGDQSELRTPIEPESFRPKMRLGLSEYSVGASRCSELCRHSGSCCGLSFRPFNRDSSVRFVQNRSLSMRPSPRRSLNIPSAFTTSHRARRSCPPFCVSTSSCEKLPHRDTHQRHSFAFLTCCH